MVFVFFPHTTLFFMLNDKNRKKTLCAGEGIRLLLIMFSTSVRHMLHGTRKIYKGLCVKRLRISEGSGGHHVRTFTPRQEEAAKLTVWSHSEATNGSMD